MYLNLRWVLNFSDEIFGSMESTRPKDFLFVPDLWQDGTITTALTLAWILLEFGLRFCWKQKSFQSWICKRTSAVKIFLFLGEWSCEELRILADELQQPLKLFENWLHEQNVNSYIWALRMQHFWLKLWKMTIYTSVTLFQVSFTYYQPTKVFAQAYLMHINFCQTKDSSNFKVQTFMYINGLIIKMRMWIRWCSPDATAASCNFTKVFENVLENIFMKENVSWALRHCFLACILTTYACSLQNANMMIYLIPGHFLYT